MIKLSLPQIPIPKSNIQWILLDILFCKMQEAARKISQFSQGIHKAPASQITQLLLQLVRSGASVYCSKCQQHCAVCKEVITTGQKLVCGHHAHLQCAKVEDWERSDYARSKRCAYCDKIVEVEGVPAQVKCWICQEKVPGRMAVILQCKDAKHFYCQADFVGMIEASLEYKQQRDGEIVCQKCQSPINQRVLFEALPKEIWKVIADKRK